MRFKVVARAHFTHSSAVIGVSSTPFTNVFIVFPYEGYTLQVGYLELLEGMSAIILESNLSFPRVTIYQISVVCPIWMSLPITFSNITYMPR